MTTERDRDGDATVKMPQLVPQPEKDLEHFDPEKTIVREEWDGVMRRTHVPAGPR